MKVISLAFPVLLVVLLAQHSQQLQFKLESNDDVCRLFPNGAKIRKPGTCNESIVCQDGKSTQATKCTNAAYGWKLETKACARVTDSYCTSTICKKRGDDWVADIKNCHDWVQCNGASKVSTGTCPVGQVFNQKLQKCMYPPSNYKCDATFDICNVSPTNQQFANEASCGKFYICNKSQKIVSQECANGKYYVARTGQCVTKALADCKKHPTPENACGTIKLAKRNRFVSDQASCRGYFYCRDLGSSVPDKNPIWAQCPVERFFDYIDEACKHRGHVKCDEDRCDGRAYGRELSEIRGCQHYVECKDNFTIAEKKCPDNKYFDPETEECIFTKVSYPICA